MNQKTEIIEFISQNPTFFLATTEGDIPHVRGMLLYRANENEIIFSTGKMKDLYRQLKLNPKVELCFYKDKLQVRIIGIAEDLDKNDDLKKEIVEARPFLKPLVEQTGYKHIAVFRVIHASATVWDMNDMMAPKSFIDLGF